MYKKDLYENRLSRSKKLRKYGSLYKAHIRRTTSKICKSPRKERITPNKNIDEQKSKKISNTKKNILNPYQKFIKSESKKEQYSHLPGKERLRLIAKKWVEVRDNK